MGHCRTPSQTHRSLYSVSYLESPHVSRVSGIFQTVLIALEEKLQEESGRQKTERVILKLFFGEKQIKDEQKQKIVYSNKTQIQKQEK